MRDAWRPTWFWRWHWRTSGAGHPLDEARSSRARLRIPARARSHGAGLRHRPLSRSGSPGDWAAGVGRESRGRRFRGWCRSWTESRWRWSSPPPGFVSFRRRRCRPSLFGADRGQADHLAGRAAGFRRSGLVPRPSGEATTVSGDELQVGPDSAWFQLSGNDPVNFGRRGPLRRTFLRLVEQRLLAPGIGVGPQRVAAGWPGERIHPSASVNRV